MYVGAINTPSIDHLRYWWYLIEKKIPTKLTILQWITFALICAVWGLFDAAVGRNFKRCSSNRSLFHIPIFQNCDVLYHSDLLSLENFNLSFVGERQNFFQTVCGGADVSNLTLGIQSNTSDPSTYTSNFTFPVCRSECKEISIQSVQFTPVNETGRFARDEFR